MFCSYACLCIIYRGQEWAWDFLEVELHTVASCRVGTGNQTWTFWKSDECSQWPYLCF